MIQHKRSFDSTAAMKALVDALASCPEVARLDRPGSDPEAAALAVSFSHLEESFECVLGQLLPRLADKETPQSELADILFEIGEQFRHILYHIGDNEFYSYLPAWGGARECDGES
jgi:hypothetical protein